MDLSECLPRYEVILLREHRGIQIYPNYESEFYYDNVIAIKFVIWNKIV